MNEHQNEVAAFIGPEQDDCFLEAELAGRVNKLLISHVRQFTILQTV